MSSGGRRRRRSEDENKNDEPGIGTMLAVGAAAAGIAALAYGAKKLYDFVSADQLEGSSKGKEMPPEDTSSSSWSAYPSAASDNVTASVSSPGASVQTVPRVLTQSTVAPKLSLAQQLENYYDEYVSILSDVLERSQQIKQEVTSLLLDFLKKYHPELNISCLQYAGPASESLQVVHPSEFTSYAGVSCDSGNWCLEEVKDRPGNYNIVRNHADTRELGMDQLDKFLDNRYLSAQKYNTALTASLREFISNPTKYTMAVLDDSASTNLKIIYDKKNCFTIKVVPCLCLQGISVISLPASKTLEGMSGSNLWERCYFSLESKILHQLDPVECCHIKCLQIIEAIRLNHPSQFAICTPYMMKTVLFHMLKETPEEDWWRHQCLTEQFVDMLNQLIYYLQGKVLPDYFDQRINLLQDVSPSSCDSLVNFITSRIGKEKLHTLLVKEYRPCQMLSDTMDHDAI